MTLGKKRSDVGDFFSFFFKESGKLSDASAEIKPNG